MTVYHALLHRHNPEHELFMYIGIAVTSHETGTLRTFTLDSMSHTGNVRGSQDPTLAANPTPEAEQVDVPKDVVLSWDPGVFAVTHDVYLGTSREDVDSADVANPMGAMLSQGQTANRVDTGRLTFDQTYYWRVDEVNGAPDRTVYKGDIWSFTVEPRAIEIENITATASGANPNMGPEKTIDGSGMNELDQHSAQPEAMWLTLTNGSWIQYQFDRAYKLHEMWVWNSNQVVEAFIGFGVKEVAIESSMDGENWIPLNGITELARASGQPTYTANTTVTLGGVMAKDIKLSVQSAHGLTGQSGLAEVRFTAIPVFPREPRPADGATATGAEVQMHWRSGREAASHDLVLSTNPDAVANGTAPVSTLSDSPALDFGTRYFWQVTEVNDAETPSAHAGDIWSFTVPEYDIFEDIESYSGEEGHEIYMTWWDGYGGDDALGGSTTGYIDSPFVETSIVNPDMGGQPVHAHVL